LSRLSPRPCKRTVPVSAAKKYWRIEQLAEMQKIIDAEKSDLFEVLALVA
jgi:hypothetical protein